MWRTCVRLALSVAVITAAAFAQYQAPASTFTTFQRYPGNDTEHAVAVDLNGDSAVDFVLFSGKTWLSNGDGTYHLGPTPAGVSGASGADPIVSGDFDGDGKPDVVFVAGGMTSFSIAYGNGDGTWRTTKSYAGIVGSYGNIIQKAVAGDFNKDGKQDLAVFVMDGYGPGQKKVAVLTNTGTDFTFSSFSAVEYAYHADDNNDYPWLIGDFAIGDFDADGKADVAYSVRYDPAQEGGPGFAHVKAVVLFGDGAGHLGSAVTVRNQDGDFRFASGDINQDGRSDLAGPSYVPPCGPGPCSTYLVLFGSSSRTFTSKSTPNASPQYSNPVIADFNGDRLMDIAVIVADSATNTFGFRVAEQSYSAPGTFIERGYYPLGSYTAAPNHPPARFLLTGDFNRDIKPDLMTVGEMDQTMYIVTNTTDMGGWAYNTGEGFPNCRQPGGRGINICQPQQNGVYTDFYNRVPVSVAASDYKPLRKIEVWIDGKKHGEQFYGFGDHVYFDALDWDITIGNHTATVYAVGYDTSLMKKSVAFSLAGSGESCYTASSTTVTICQPVAGSTVNSPVEVHAVGGSSITYMELWEGGIKRFGGAQQYIDVQLTLAPGTHTATVFGKVGSTVTDRKQVTFTVAGSGGGTCAPSSATTAVICSPAPNSTVSSPVSVNAKGGSSVNYMEVWVDGVKKGFVNSNTLSLTVALGAGQHRLTVYAKVNGTLTDKQTEYFTVK